MTEEERFLKTMIETVKYDEYENRDELLAILRSSILTFHKTGSFTSKSWQYWEYIDLRVPVVMLKKVRELEKILNKLVEDIYVETDEYDFRNIRIKPKLIELDEERVKEHDVVFNEIQDTIIQGIRNAKYTVWIAVAWFTDKAIFNELILKKNEGVNIRIITSNEQSNRHILKELEENFEVKKVSLKGKYLSNRLHDKFCIVDLEYVMHGSYNWSKNAQSNDETLATALDKDFVIKFTDEFIRLFNEN